MRPALALLLASLFAASPASAETADTVLYNGKIVTVDKDFSVREAIAIGHGRVLATGTSAAMKKLADKVEWFTADHEAAGSDDLCFLTASTPDEVVAHLKANGVKIEEGPTKKQGARGTILSVYCRDPDGSLIEISSYEK